MNINGVLSIRTIQGCNGPFNVGRLITLDPVNHESEISYKFAAAALVAVESFEGVMV